MIVMMDKNPMSMTMDGWMDRKTMTTVTINTNKLLMTPINLVAMIPMNNMTIINL